MRLSVVSVGDYHYLAFNNNGTTFLLCDAATGKGLRCTHEGAATVQFGANCSAPITFKNTEDVNYPNKLNATLSNADCSLDDGDMQMTLLLTFGDYVASEHERLIKVNSESSLLFPEWEVNEQ